MNIVIRADASIHIGSGHVMRCLVLAEALKMQGHNVRFASRPQDGDLIQFVREKGFDVYELYRPQQSLVPAHSADYEAWLQVPWEDDAASLTGLVNDVDLLIVDHYALDYKWEIRVSSELRCRMLVVDDLERQHDCDLILDQNLWHNVDTRYSGSKKCRVLNGPRYALLRPTFSDLRHAKSQLKEQVLVFFGGSDPTSECLKVTKALSQLSELPYTVLLVTGKSNSDFDKIEALVDSGKCCVHRFLNDFEQELALSKYAIGASGVSNWERFCLKVPTTVVSVADNQVELSEYLSELGAVHYIGTGNETAVETYRQEFIRLIGVWDKLSPDVSIDVDGLGAKRVIEEIGRLMS